MNKTAHWAHGAGVAALRCTGGNGLRAVAGMAAAVLLVGCASTFSTQVTMFQQWPANAAGATYAIESPAAAAPQPGSVALSELERKTYEGYLKQHLEAQGLVPATAPAHARLLADMQVQMRRELVQVSRPEYVPAPYFGFGFGHHWSGWGAGFDWGYSSYYCDDGPLAGPMRMCLVERTVTQPVERYRLTVRIANRSQAAKGQPASQVFESTAEYAGNPASLPALMPVLMETAFDHFPGANGQTRSVVFDAKTGARIAPR